MDPQQYFSIFRSFVETSSLGYGFSDLDGNIIYWFWDFGDESPDSTSFQSNPTHKYLAPGNYDVKLTVSTVHGSNTLIREDYVRVQNIVAPTAQFTAEPRELFETETVKFTDFSEFRPTKRF